MMFKASFIRYWSGLLLFTSMLATASEVEMLVEDSVDIYSFQTKQQESLFKELIFELRCPKCQNQNLMDSNSEISQYMKKRIHKMVSSGANKDEVVKKLSSRYGDFITYKPPLNIQTATLWLLPLCLLILAVILFVKNIVSNRDQIDEQEGNDVSRFDHDEKFSSWLKKRKRDS